MPPRPWQRRSIDAPGETVLVSTRLTPEEVEELKALSGTLSYHVRQAVRFYLENWAEKLNK